MELEKKHWEQAKLDNQNLILQSKLMIQMAEASLKLISKKITEFPKEKIKGVQHNPTDRPI